MNMSEGLKSLSHQYVSAAVSLATTVTRLGQYEKAVQTYKIALPEVDPKQDGWRWAMTMMGMGWAERCMGRLQEALLHSQQSHAMLVKLDHPDRLLVEHNLAILEMDMGNLREALAKLEQCKASYRNGGNIGQEASVGEDITRCHLRLEQLQQARKEADQALRLLDLADNNWIRGRLYLLKAEIAMRLGQETEAHSFLDIGTAIFRRVRAVAELQRAEELGRMLTAPVNVTPSEGSL
jgi:tetratricopeptide (TPR) repeat protein